jgi:hypothetical protein
MDLVKDIKENDGILEGLFTWNLYRCETKVLLFDGATIEYAELCIEHLNSLGRDTIERIFEACIRYCNDFLDYTGREKREFEQPSEILDHMTPTSLSIDEPEDPAVPTIHLEMECDWDIEHGVEIIVRKDEVLYVGGFNGGSPWFDYSEKQSWNYA